MGEKNTQTEEKETLVDCLYKSKLAPRLIEVVAPIVSKHVKETLDTKVSYDSIGSENERKLKETLFIHEKIRTVVEDIVKTIGFLNVEDKDEITELFPFLEDQQEYYNYFFENFIIRMASIPDSLAMLANHVNEYGYSPCYGTTIVRDTKRVVDVTEKDIMQRLLNASHYIRNKRHKKVHEGEVKHEYLDGIVFYNDLIKLVGTDFEGSDLLIELDNNKLKESVASIENDAKAIIDIVVEYLDTLVLKIDKWIDK